MASSSKRKATSTRGGKKQKKDTAFDPTYFVSSEAATMYREAFSTRSFIFGKIVDLSYFTQFGFKVEALFEKIGWGSFLALKSDMYPTIVKEFYANVERIDDESVKTFVRGQEIVITRDRLDVLYNLPKDAIRKYDSRTWPTNVEGFDVLVALNEICGRTDITEKKTPPDEFDIRGMNHPPHSCQLCLP